MLSKQKTNGLFNKRYLRGAKNKGADIERNSIMSGRISITSIRIKNNKYFRIELPSNNPLNKPTLKLNLNTMPRANYKDGSKEMYRLVNGLCQYCGHRHYDGKIVFSNEGYMLKDIYCTGCASKQPWDYIHIYTNKNQRNRGKDYSERKKSNTKKNKNYSKKKEQDFIKKANRI